MNIYYVKTIWNNLVLEETRGQCEPVFPQNVSSRICKKSQQQFKLLAQKTKSSA